MAQGVDLSSESGQTALAQIKRQILETLIEQLIIEQEAARRNIVLTEPAVEAAAQASIVQVEGQAPFEVWLAANQLSYEEFKGTLRAQLLANQVFEAVTHEIPDPAGKAAAFSNWLAKQRAAALIEWYGS